MLTLILFKIIMYCIHHNLFAIPFYFVNYSSLYLCYCIFLLSVFGIQCPSVLQMRLVPHLPPSCLVQLVPASLLGLINWGLDPECRALLLRVHARILLY